MEKYTVDFSKVKYYIEIHEVLKRDLDFPDYYGGNTDALWDCLTDMLGDPSYIELFAFEEVQKRYFCFFSFRFEPTRFNHIEMQLLL